MPTNIAKFELYDSIFYEQLKYDREDLNKPVETKNDINIIKKGIKGINNKISSLDDRMNSLENRI